MILSISGVVLLGVIAFLFFKKDGLKASHGLVCALFGFYVAGTAIAPSITAGGASLASMLGGIKF
ncbi:MULTISPECIES: hypothetical protein [unclassified Streptomyces]|uniref:hypothetical protein n=1 Tax=unclassified Streptomyces TaxID=2593676 RepID=UPI0013C08962|nr:MULTISPECIES: hypothetical protein [unclassified Streptomyces]WSS47946.1 hypothetical protein OG708_04440 [Streptomyces sp. NBC_01180]WSU45565.1 hypothetical protein OG510_32460 [Streptomyces sp. NBC_01089]WSV00519.1 hypothetical protein OG217_32515 [Streptomyces sp. NBC_01023]WSZ85876.1 hypothetical protein OG584_30135 [Streptomyces sp. NBC_00859]NDZ83784.1 hypothetical protein [Streptomyces sp. SID10853]